MSPRSLASFLALALLAAPAVADDGFLRFLPSDTKVVLIVNVPAMSEQERRTVAELLRQVYAESMVPEVEKFDKLPISDLDQIVIAQPNAGGFGGVVVLRGKVDVKLAESQMRGAAKLSKGALTVEQVGKPAVPVFRRKVEEKTLIKWFPFIENIPSSLGFVNPRKMMLPQDLYAAALDDRTVFISLAGKGNVERALRARPKDAKPRTSEELTKLLKARDSKDIATAVLLEGSLHPGVALLAPQETRETFEQFDHLVVRIQSGKKVGVLFTATGKSKEDAEALEKKAKGAVEAAQKGLEKAVPDKAMREALEGLFKTFKVTRKEAVVTVAGTLSEEDARKLLPKVGKKE